MGLVRLLKKAPKIPFMAAVWLVLLGNSAYFFTYIYPINNYLMIFVILFLLGLFIFQIAYNTIKFVKLKPKFNLIKVIIWALILIVFGGYLVPFQTTLSLLVAFSRPSETSSSIKISDQIYETLNKHKDKSLFKEGPTREQNGHIWWIADDQYNIWVPTQTVSMKILAVNDNYQDKDTFKKINQSVNAIMNSNNFTLNKLNSSDSESDKKFYDYVQAFEHKRIRCVATSSADVGNAGETQLYYSTFSFGCFDDDQFKSAYNEQTTFLKVFENENRYTVKGNPGLILSYLRVKGNLAKMGIHGRRSGSAALMYKTEGEWKLITSGQEAPHCDELIERNIPKDIWPPCNPPSRLTESEWNERNSLWSF